MNKLFRSLSIVVLFAALFFNSACFEKTSSSVRSVDANETMGLLKNSFAVLVDVREKDEMIDGKASDAIWLPLSKIKEDPKVLDVLLKDIPKDKEVILYCKSGGRAGTVAKQISEKGWKAANMGGFSGWVAAGYPVKKIP